MREGSKAMKGTTKKITAGKGTVKEGSRNVKK